MSRFSFTRGLHELGNGVYAYLQPSGSWGWSNAGLIVGDDGRSLLVDTLFDLPNTRQMLGAMQRATPAAREIDLLVNTHANADHCWGNQLVGGAEIIASTRAAAEMKDLSPRRTALLISLARLFGRLGAWGPRVGRAIGRLGLGKVEHVAQAATLVCEAFGGFDFDGISLTLPTRTFDDRLQLRLAGKQIELLEVGPAHTSGDVLVYSPEDRTIFTGDILFVDSHPIIWAGPISNWIAACDLILKLPIETVVPGHGPITDLAGVQRQRDYLKHLLDQARKCNEAGLSAQQAAHEISFADYGGYLDRERIIVNVQAVYRELRGQTEQPDVVQAFAEMAHFCAR